MLHIKIQPGGAYVLRLGGGGDSLVGCMYKTKVSPPFSFIFNRQICGADFLNKDAKISPKSSEY